MVVGVLLMIGILFSILFTISILKNKNIVETITIGVCLYFCTHAFISYILFLTDTYSIIKAVGFSALATGIFALSALIKNKFKLKITDTNIKEFIIPILIILVLSPFVRIKNEYYGMGQDQGVYQTQALAFLDNDTKAIKDFPNAYEQADYDRELFEAKVAIVTGFDLTTSGFMDHNYSPDSQKQSGYFHGIPVFTSFMATWASIFGYENMQGIQTVFFVLLLTLTYMCARNIGLKYYLCCLAEFAVGFCPLIIWLGKSALTELYLGVLIAMFLYFITLDNSKMQIYSIIPVIIFALYHVSFYTKAPVFIGIYGMMYLFSHRKSHAYLMLSIPVISALGFWTMVWIQPMYTVRNYKFLLGKYSHTVPTQNIPYYASAFFAILLICELVYILLVNKLSKKPCSIASLSNNKIFLNILRALIVLPILKIAVGIYLKRDKTLPLTRSLLHQLKIQTLFRFALGTCIILFAIAVIWALINPKKLLKDANIMWLSIMFFYCVFINSSLLTVTVPNLYYWGRYLVPFISISAIFVMAMINELNSKVVYSAFVLSMAINVPANIFLLNHVDDTKINWHNLSDIAEKATQKDTVIVSNELEIIMWMPMRYLSDAPVYPQLGDLAGQANDILSNSEGDVYVISSKTLNYDVYNWELVYSDDVTYVPDPSGPYPETLTYPNSFNEESKPIYVYRLSHKQKEPFAYTVKDYYYSYTGLSAWETEYAWTCNSDVILDCFLEDTSYTVSVDFYGGVPYVDITGEPYDIKVYVNDNYVETITVTTEENHEGFSFEIDGSYITNGNNKIKLSSDLWSGSILNPNETREFGYPLQAITFTKN